MTSQDINALVRERAKLQAALRQIRNATDSPTLGDDQKVQKIRAALSTVQQFIPD